MRVEPWHSLVSGMGYGAGPALGAPDFQAYVEVYLADSIGQGRWYIFDTSGTTISMGFVWLCARRDAADIALATIFGSATAAHGLSAVD
jgi:transglutaminase-like putative cysteine protease